MSIQKEYQFFHQKITNPIKKQHGTLTIYTELYGGNEEGK